MGSNLHLIPVYVAQLKSELGLISSYREDREDYREDREDQTVKDSPLTV